MKGKWHTELIPLSLCILLLPACYAIYCFSLPHTELYSTGDWKRLISNHIQVLTLLALKKKKTIAFKKYRALLICVFSKSAWSWALISTCCSCWRISWPAAVCFIGRSGWVFVYSHYSPAPLTALRSTASWPTHRQREEFNILDSRHGSLCERRMISACFNSSLLELCFKGLSDSFTWL